MEEHLLLDSLPAGVTTVQSERLYAHYSRAKPKEHVRLVTSSPWQMLCTMYSPTDLQRKGQKDKGQRGWREMSRRAKGKKESTDGFEGINSDRWHKGAIWSKALSLGGEF